MERGFRNGRVSLAITTRSSWSILDNENVEKGLGLMIAEAGEKEEVV